MTSELAEQPASEAAAKKLSSRTVIIVAVAALLVLAGVGTGIFLLTKGDDPSPAAGNASESTSVPGGGQPAGGSAAATPAPGGAPADVNNAKAVAEKAIQAINAHDPEAMKKISCDPEAIGPAESTPAEARVELVSAPELSGDTATVELKLTIGDQSTTTPLPLRKVNGNWCVD